jgi:hypothetical protein
MKSSHKLFWTLCVLAFAATALPGCGTQSGQNAKVQEINQQGQNLTQNRESAGITTRNDVSSQMNSSIKGVQNSTVLVHNGNAYVGLTEIGTEHTPDAAMKSGDNWSGLPFGTQAKPNSARGMTVQQQLAEGIPNGNTHSGPYSTLTGNLSPGVVQSTIHTVSRMVPGVRNVYITGNHDDVQKLAGYKFYINRGGNMNPHMGDFNSFINRVFHSQPPVSTQSLPNTQGKAGTMGQTSGPSHSYRTLTPGTGNTNTSKSSNDTIGSGTTESAGNQDVEGMGTNGVGSPIYHTNTPGTGTSGVGPMGTTGTGTYGTRVVRTR